MVTTNGPREQLVSMTAADGVTMEGWFSQPAGPVSSRAAVILVHGYRSNFHNPYFRACQRALLETGYASLAINTRNYGYFALDGHFEPQVEDVAAAMAFLLGEGYGRFALLGHSMGASIVSAYVTQKEDWGVGALVASGGVARAGDWWRYCIDSLGKKPGEYEKLLTLARAKVVAGKGLDIMWFPARPYAGVLAYQINTCRAWLNLAEPDSNVSAVKHVAGLRCPVLVIHGEADPVVPPDSARAIYEAAPEPKKLVFVSGADHTYTGKENEAARLVVQWLRETYPRNTAD